ncbi:S8 family peptidase [Haladaptatus sp. T7]|uniref:S8 family peptidase n=1 Tax=Haladaptatus sp. T7 TaxID=2029368 RepID=UPI0021A2545D|nr:S8 family peptidase [Haladaptatus sp. T7]GKZ13273.1 subtilisin E [Haladaptatus sp. T7]
MSKEIKNATRRSVLKATGVSMVGVGASGVAAGKRELREVNIGFESRAGRRLALESANDVVREFSGIDAVTIRVPEVAISALESAPGVTYVEENGTMHALGETLPWGVDRVDGEVATANGATGTGVDVAVVDTGIDANHPDLQANVGSGKSFVGSSWSDDNGHGTHVAGTIAAVDNYSGVVGVAPGTTLHAVKVLSSTGAGSYSDIAAGIEWAADHGHDVINLSLGGSSSSSTVDAVVQYAYDNGCLLVGAAGGSGPCSGGCVGYPASASEVIAVSATNQSDDIASFSSRGPEIELAAPGQDIESTYWDDTYETLSGTSMATAHVSGAAAQVMAAGYSNTGARQRLRDTAEDLGLSSDEQGYGLVDVAAALGFDSSNN